MNGGRVYRLFIAVLLCAVSTSVHAGLVNVQEISVSFPIVFYYQGGAPGYFHVTNASTIVGNVQTVGASGYDYALSATVNVDNCDLVADNSSGGWAEGEFAGGATMTLVGDLWDVSDPGTLLVDDGIILQAQMVLTSAETWTLSEIGGNPRDIDGTMDFTPTNGVLVQRELDKCLSRLTLKLAFGKRFLKA